MAVPPRGSAHDDEISVVEQRAREHAEAERRRVEECERAFHARLARLGASDAEPPVCRVCGVRTRFSDTGRIVHECAGPRLGLAQRLHELHRLDHAERAAGERAED